MPSDRQQILKIVTVTTLVILFVSAFPLGWLYFGAMEHEKDRLAHLAILHVRQLEATSQKAVGADQMAISQEFFTNRIQQLFNHLRVYSPPLAA